MFMHTDTASRFVLIAQIATVVCAALAVGAFVAPIGDRAPVLPQSTPSDRPTGEAPESAASTDLFEAHEHRDWTLVAERLAWASPEAPPVTADAGEDSNDDSGQPIDSASGTDQTRADGAVNSGDFAPSPPVLRTWRYLGPMILGNSSAALMAIDGKQRFIVAGATIDGYELKSVEPSHVVVEQRGVQHRIDLQPSTVGAASVPFTSSDSAREQIERARQQRDQRERRLRDQVRDRSKDEGDA